MRFKLSSESVVLQGDPSLHKTQVSLKSMVKAIKDKGQGVLLELGSMGVNSEPTVIKGTNSYTGVLQQFPEIFKWPNELPPSRAQDHTIVIKPNSALVYVRPYRYLYVQKNEIERLVREMLAAEIIQPGFNSFSSLVLLVKKKDGSWRFCVDYRALNKVTIPARFPIPMIDELLDELHGAKIFSKLDLKSRFHQIRVRAEAVPKTAFCIREGHYEFLVMPFGLTNAPTTFQSLTNEAFKPYL